MRHSYQTRFRNLLESTGRDISYGSRVLLKHRGFSLTTILTLALGIGANTAIFSVIYGVILRPLPYRDSSQLVVIHQPAPLAHIPDLGFSVKEVNDYRQQNQSMESVVEYHSMNFILYGRDEPQRVQTGVVSANFFDVLGVKPILGRTFEPGDETPSSQAVIVLSYKYWQTSHGGNANIVGQTFSMNNRPHIVIGVLPPIPQYPADNDVYMPTVQCPFRSAPTTIENRSARIISTMFGRLKPGVSLAQAQNEFSTIATRFVTGYPEAYPKNSGYTASVNRLDNELTRQARPTFFILLATAGLVLLIACANVANLSLARVLQRQKEVALRNAVGATGGRLIRQWLTESIMLAIIGGGVGLLIAKLGLPLLVAYATRFTNRTGEIRIDLSVLLFTTLISLGTGVAFGIVPALSLCSTHDLAGALKEESSRSTSGSKNRLRGLLVVTQVAVSFALLITAGLMVRSFMRLQNVSAGFNPEKVLVLRMSTNWSKLTTNTQLADFFQRIVDEAKQQPGVQDAAVSSTYPLNPAGITRGPNNVAIQIEGHTPADGELAPRVDPRAVSPDYFRTVGMSLISGRSFTTADTEKAQQVIIVNQTTARRRWKGEDPVGNRISFDNGRTWVTIVGVVSDVKQYGLDHEASEEVYAPVAQAAFASFLLIKTSGNPEILTNVMRDTIHRVNPETAVDQVRTLQQVRDESVAGPRLTTWLIGLFAGLALLITAAGITGVMALAVTQRTSEIGIRMALGATRARVLAMMMRQGMSLVAVGVAAGVAGALAINRVVASILFATAPTDILTFIAVSAMIVAVAAVACGIPALRATSINPLRALRNE